MSKIGKELTKLEHLLYVKAQMGVLWIDKRLIYAVRTFALLFVAWQIEYLFLAFNEGQITLLKGHIYPQYTKPFGFWLGVTMHAVFILVGVWLSTLGTADKTKKNRVQELLEVQRNIKRKPVINDESKGRFAIFAKLDKVQAVDTDSFIARGRMQELLSNGYECEAYIDAETEEQALIAYKSIEN